MQQIIVFSKQQVGVKCVSDHEASCQVGEVENWSHNMLSAYQHSPCDVHDGRLGVEWNVTISRVITALGTVNDFCFIKTNEFVNDS